MAIPFSTPKSRRNRRESLATRSEPRDVTFSDLSLSSQVFYFAMLEALKMLKSVAEDGAETTEQVNTNHHSTLVDSGPEQSEADEVDFRHKKISPSSSHKDVNIEENQETQTNLHDKSSESKNIKQLPDLIPEYQSANELSQNLPDIVPITDSSVPVALKSCGDSVSNDPSAHGLTTYQTDQISTNGLLMTDKNCPDLEPKRSPQIRTKVRLVPGTPSLKKDDLNKPHNWFVILDETAQIIRGKPQIEANSRTGNVKSCPDRQKGTWQMIGRDLSRIADGLDKRNTHTNPQRFNNHESSNFHNQHTRLQRRGTENEDLLSSRVMPADAVDSRIVASNSERVVGIDWRTLNHGADNRNNHHGYDGLCHQQLIQSSNLQHSISNIALNGIMYIIQNLC